MKLYGSLTSPYVRKVRIVLAEKGIEHEFVAEGPWDAAGNVARVNPFCKVPVLVRDDGEAIFDSPMIVDYLDSLQGVPLIPPSGEARWKAQRWHALGQGVAEAVVARMLEMRRASGHQDAVVIQRQENAVASAMHFAEARISDEGFLMEHRITIADIALGTALGYVDHRYPHDWRTRHPRLAAWLAVISRRPSFTGTAPP